MNTISIEYLRELLEYDPLNGVFTWKVKPCRRIPKGAIAGSPTRKGYIRIKIGRIGYRAHRLAFAIQTGSWPSEYVDHIDGNRANNKWSNLREADRFENQHNRGLNKNNPSGYKGVRKVGNIWYAKVQTRGVVATEVCSNLPDALNAVKALREAHHGDFVHHG